MRAAPQPSPRYYRETEAPCPTPGPPRSTSLPNRYPRPPSWAWAPPHHERHSLSPRGRVVKQPPGHVKTLQQVRAPWRVERGHLGWARAVCARRTPGVRMTHTQTHKPASSHHYMRSPRKTHNPPTSVATSTQPGAQRYLTQGCSQRRSRDAPRRPARCPIRTIRRGHNLHSYECIGEPSAGERPQRTTTSARGGTAGHRVTAQERSGLWLWLSSWLRWSWSWWLWWWLSRGGAWGRMGVRLAVWWWECSWVGAGLQCGRVLGGCRWLGSAASTRSGSIDVSHSSCPAAVMMCSG